MKRSLIRALALLLCLTTVFGALSIQPVTEQAEARTIFDVEKEIKEYQSLLSDLQAEMKTISANIKNLEGKAGETQALLEQHLAEIDILEGEISINTAIMESYDAKRAEVMTEMAIVREDYDYRVSMYRKLMQFIYENGNVNAFELLFSSDNFSDYLTRRDNFNDIMNAASELIKDIEVSMARLDELDADLAGTQEKYDKYLTELNAKKLDMETKIAEFNAIADSLDINAGELQTQYASKNTKITEIKNKIKKLEEERKAYYNSTAAFRWPVKTSSYRVTSQYGWRRDPFGKPTSEYHKGIDIACSRGTPILAVKDGVVTRASWNGGYGNCVIIYHGNGISSLYAHCDNAYAGKPIYEVKVGQSVKAGQVLAYVGTTGRSTGYHLHFGVIDTKTYTSNAGNYVNPNKYLPDGYYTKKS